MPLYRKDKSLKGFTLVELLIVIVIISILAVVALVRYRSVVERTRASKAWTTLFDIANAEKRYFLEEDSYTEDLLALDIYDADPSTADTDFEYSFNEPNPNIFGDEWAIAARIGSEGGRLSYRLNLTGTRETSLPDGSFP